MRDDDPMDTDGAGVLARRTYVRYHAGMTDERYAASIRAFLRKRGRMPSYREVMGITGLRSTGSVAKLVARLKEAGLIRTDATGRLLPAPAALPLLGSVAAGFPIPAEEDLADTMSLDEFLVENPEGTFLLKVSGDSMVDAGIMPGDLLVVDRAATPRAGQIVVAEVDREWTVKYLRLKGGKPYLEAANARYPDIVPVDRLQIAAVVRGVVRKY